ncbi:MAG: hypothetical protein EA353_10800 [Puniceicoccaceae bacterium]|nr:MAG: hypothetical protein EA353_10800 [Puniceicoccaceae bacterium]
MRYRLSQAGNSVTTGYNGRQGWIRSESLATPTIKQITGSALRDLQEQARFESPLIRHREKRENQIVFLEQQTRPAGLVYVIEVTRPDGHVSHHYIDAQTMQLLQLDRLDAAGTVLSETFYRDYREVGGFPFAHEVEHRIGGETVSLATVESITVNPGLLSFFFEVPTR